MNEDIKEPDLTPQPKEPSLQEALADVDPTPKKVGTIPVEETPVDDDGLPRVRTYKEDVAEAVKSQKASLTSIVAAEETRRHSAIPEDITQPERQFNVKKIVGVIGGILLVGASVGIIGYIVFFNQQQQPTVQQDVPSLIFAEKQKQLDITGLTARKILQQLGEERQVASLSLGQVEYLYMTKTTAGDATPHIISTEEFFTSIQAKVSGAFVRSLGTEFMFGIHSFNRNQPFLIFTSSSYQSSFAGMLEWEDTMYQDLSLFMGKNVDPASGQAVNPQTGEQVVVKQNFEDLIIQNIDTRVLRSGSGDIQLLYAFPNQQTLIITTNESTLIEAITRLHNVRVF